MAGVTVTLEAQAGAPVLAVLQRLASLGRRMEPVYADIGEYLLQSHDERWGKQESPEGVPWAPLSEAYKARKTKNADKILVLNGYLQLLHYQASESGLEFGTDRVYGAMMHFGSDGPVEVPAHTRTITQAFGKELKKPVKVNVKAHSFDPNIPARPFLGLSEEDKTEVLSIVQGWLGEEMGDGH